MSEHTSQAKQSASAPASGARGVLRRQCACGTHAQGESCGDCARKKKLHRKAGDARTADRVPEIVHDVLASPGRPLDADARRHLEPAFGRDFSHVRVHTDGRAADSAKSVGALAYTVGSDVVFGAGQHRPETPEGRRLLAHELTHVTQRTSASDGARALEIGSADAAEESEADRMADAVARGRAAGLRAGGESTPTPGLRRNAVPGSIGWKGSTGPNTGTKLVGGIERIPLEGLGVGHQSGRGFSGRALVLRSPSLDVEQPVDVLLHFHGHNRGYEETAAGTVRDASIDEIESQLARSNRPQLVAVLPQGTPSSSFGETSIGGGKTTKSFDPDAYVANVFAVLTNVGVWKTAPKVAGVMISGHSGAGELINEKILGSALGSSIGAGASPTTGSKAPARFKELALFDAINGPMEHARLSEFLQMKMAAELRVALSSGTDDERAKALGNGFKFRAYYSHSKKTGTFYSEWHVGPIANPKAVYKDSIKELIDKFLAANAAALGGTTSKAYQAFAANYRVIDAGATIDHDEMVAHDHLEDAIGMLPKREAGAASGAATIPASVHGALDGTGRALDDRTQRWANAHFGRDLGGVRIHDGDLAARSARSVSALAYTAGRDIVFDRGRYEPATEPGRRLLAHELAHVVQQGARPVPASRLSVGAVGDALEVEADRAARSPSSAHALALGAAAPRVQRAPATVDAGMCEATKNDHPAQLGTCNYKEPENCPTYEGWIHTFTLLKTFEASDTPKSSGSGFRALGGAAADQDFRKASPPAGAAPAPKSFAPLKPGERFIDHPTDAWVQTCLPENLRATAYQLPADCADIAMILRHVWLAAHHRTQRFGSWTLGNTTGKADERNVLDVIANAGTEQVANLVAAYSDDAGKPIRSIKKLAPLFHPGDILVWWHYDNGFDKPRTGGHTHTIADVQRDESGTLKGLTLLQGNEPLFAPQKQEIHEFLKAEKPRRAQPDDATLGHAPGRRIERATSAGIGFQDSVPSTDKSTEPIWKWGATTLLIVAGPPKSAPRPAMAAPTKGAKSSVRALSDWIAAFKRATAANLVATFEGMLYEARATIEAGGSFVEADARSVGAAAGRRLWTLAKAAGDLGNTSHFKPLQEILDMLAGFVSSRPTLDPTKGKAFNDVTTRLKTQLEWIKDAFELAARGISDVTFPAATGKKDPVNVIVTGFDPFDTTGSLRRPGSGEWNPSGAAALALDGARIPVASSKGAKGTAAVESFVLPVSFDDFRGGIVEKAITPHVNEVDAVLTVSMDPSINPTDPVRLERYAVGVHGVQGKLEGVPAGPGGSAGAAIVESTAPLKEIAANTKTAPKAKPEVPEPTIGEGITFDFGTPAAADAALAALGLPAARANRVVISDEAALRQIISTMKRTAASASITFQAGGKTFTTTVVSGPGGNFLSNEVSYRVLRQLGASGGAKHPLSFHTHTQRGDAIPEDTGTTASKKARADARTAASSVRTRLVDTLRRIIAAVGRVVLDRRPPSTP